MGSIRVDNRSEVASVRNGARIFSALLLINGIVLRAFHVSGFFVTAAFILIAAGIPILVWISLHQKTFAVEMDSKGIVFFEEIGREEIVRNAIRNEDVEAVAVIKQGPGIFWCRVVPKHGKGILLGNFQNKHITMITRIMETWPEKIQVADFTPREKQEKKSHDCLL